MNLGKPPIVEVSVSFWFEAPAGEPDWEFARAAEFIDRFRADYPDAEVASTEQLVRVQKFARGTKPVLEPRLVPVAVRAFPPDRGRYILSAKDLVQCIFLRTPENGYPGFTALKGESMRLFAAYSEFFRPVKLLGFALRYVDLVRVPLTGGRVVLKDYFTICQDPDETTFGVAGFIRNGFTTLPLEPIGDVLTFEIYNILKAADPDDPVIPFRMEWSVQGGKGLTLRAADVEARLDAARDRLGDCFRKSFTEKGWALFAPQADGP